MTTASETIIGVVKERLKKERIFFAKEESYSPSQRHVKSKICDQPNWGSVK